MTCVGGGGDGGIYKEYEKMLHGVFFFPAYTNRYGFWAAL